MKVYTNVKVQRKSANGNLNVQKNEYLCKNMGALCKLSIKESLVVKLLSVIFFFLAFLAFLCFPLILLLHCLCLFMGFFKHLSEIIVITTSAERETSTFSETIGKFQLCKSLREHKMFKCVCTDTSRHKGLKIRKKKLISTDRIVEFNR